MTSCSQTCMNKATHCSAPRALSQCSNHSESARFARKARAKRLLPHVWAFAKASRTFVRARCSFGFGSLLYSYCKHRECIRSLQDIPLSITLTRGEKQNKKDLSRFQRDRSLRKKVFRYFQNRIKPDIMRLPWQYLPGMRNLPHR